VRWNERTVEINNKECTVMSVLNVLCIELSVMDLKRCIKVFEEDIKLWEK